MSAAGVQEKDWTAGRCSEDMAQETSVMLRNVLLKLATAGTVKSTSPVTENHYKNGYENCTYSMTTNEDNNHDTKYINKHTDANHDTRKLHE